MIMETHMLIGQKVFNNINELTNMNLNRTSFIFGNMKPDIVYSLLKKSHRMKDSLYFVIKEIDKLLTSEIKDKNKFSSSLGVINHFLSDFFCSAHYYNLDKFNGGINHIRYELKLHKTFKKMEKEKQLNLQELNINRYMKDTVLNSIYSLENEYKKQEPSMENDIIFALRVSTVISVYILNNSVSTKSILVAA
ncbi:zinc dependent phospholipase C family protein [Alkaliphilus pronyensis]|uniref:Zinc dependent phospholipase C family protein n=1 Tax=Alkaliphilus pronyensis TaxID=1482732 RepID=A0A6I0F1D6_9FIRM|nr:zinc dependent phospholipase C family protein [Alkaliphilus pronyensis]KAB3535747.1 zinc dependent phospholipase C family protein [Alkaliphilus pronyensis]